MKYICDYCCQIFEEESDCTAHEHICPNNMNPDDEEDGQEWTRETRLEDGTQDGA